MAKDNLKIISFVSQSKWEKWLKKNHLKSNGVWLRLFKKKIVFKAMTYDEALDVALCYGWIDALKKSYDEKSWIQRFTPRRPRSGWSKRNTEHVKRLIRLGKMASAGFLEIKAAKKDGRWKSAYDSPSNSKVPVDFMRELRGNKKALAFFQTLNKANQYAISYRLQTAKKPETREKRKNLF